MAGFRRFNTRVISGKDVKPIPDEELEALYMWVDGIPLSRPKKNLSRDFADGVMAAEVVHHFIPGLVERHNYQSANSAKAKKENWLLLDRKVLSHLEIELKEDVINKVIDAQQWAIEKILIILRDKIELYLADQKNRPEADQYGTGARPTGQGLGGGRFNKSQSLQNLSRTRRKGNEMVPRQELTAKEELIAQQTETIQMLTEKIQKLEHLCDLKDRRIEDMTEKVEQLQSSRQPRRQNRGQQGYARQPQGRWN